MDLGATQSESYRLLDYLNHSTRRQMHTVSPYLHAVAVLQLPHETIETAPDHEDIARSLARWAKTLLRWSGTMSPARPFQPTRWRRKVNMGKRGKADNSRRSPSSTIAGIDWSKLRVTDLKKELKQRLLLQKGRKEDLIRALEEWEDAQESAAAVHDEQ